MGGLNKLLFFYVKNSKFDFNKSKSVIRYCIAIAEKAACVACYITCTRVSVYRFLLLLILPLKQVSVSIASVFWKLATLVHMYMYSSLKKKFVCLTSYM